MNDIFSIIEKKHFLSPSPLEIVDDEFLKNSGIQLHLKRDDLIHPIISGNKWRKLKFNISEAINHGKTDLISFGGPYSNHLLAFAASCDLFGLNCHAYHRGNIDESNPVIKFLRSKNAQLHELSYTAYRKRNDPPFLNQLMVQHHSESILIPEGGNNDLAKKGIEELSREITAQLDSIDYACVAIGTGATFCGLNQFLTNTTIVQGFCIFTHKQNQKQKQQMIQDAYHEEQFIDDYHFGGLGSFPDELLRFIQQFKTETGILLDRSYNAKMMYGIYDRIAQGKYPKGTKIVVLNTGGNFVDKLIDSNESKT